MCLYEITIRNKKYMPNKKNGGTAPKLEHEEFQHVQVKCGRCIECLNEKKREWQCRLSEEIKEHKNGRFITLTFSEKYLDKFTKDIGNDANNIAKRAIRLFLERWRKEKGISPRHWFVTELGHESTERLHLHGIIFTNATHRAIKRRWKYGEIWVGEYTNLKTINYIVKYICKLDPDHKFYKPIVLCSPGIGRGYINSFNYNKNKFEYENTDTTYRLNNGAKIALPKYYKNKLYDENEREYLWGSTQQKMEKYVMGIKIKTENENGKKEFERAIYEARKRNEALGYGKRLNKTYHYGAKKKNIPSKD